MALFWERQVLYRRFSVFVSFVKCYPLSLRRLAKPDQVLEN